MELMHIVEGRVVEFIDRLLQHADITSWIGLGIKSVSSPRYQAETRYLSHKGLLRKVVAL